MDHERCCFVVMPFGRKPVGERRERWLGFLPWPKVTRRREVDFDRIYDTVFLPAIEGAKMPDGGKLSAQRTDRDFFSGSIGHEMFMYLEYSRMVLADISGLNANVFYELGHRHRARPSGTAIFRQIDAPIPFDIQQIKAFPYEYEPEAAIEESRNQIARVLSESLARERPDSPIQLALAAQRAMGEDVHSHLRNADSAIRDNDTDSAIDHYLRAEKAGDENALLELKIALLYRETGDQPAVIEHCRRALQADASFAPAWREQGIAENRIHRKTSKPPSGEASLRRAIEHEPEDFDALSSLGGILKREQRLGESMEMYQRAAEVSDGHPYPLLNYLTLRGHVDGEVPDDSKTALAMQRAERFRKAQAEAQPAIDAPWCFFDLAQLRLLRGDRGGFDRWVVRGVRASTHDYEPGTFADTLQLLQGRGMTLPGLKHGINSLRQAQARLGNRSG